MIGIAHIDFEQNLWTLVYSSDFNDTRSVCFGFHSLEQAKAYAAKLNLRAELSNRAIVKSLAVS